VKSYLREAGTATICRVAGVGGYTEIAPLLLTSVTGVDSTGYYCRNYISDGTGSFYESLLKTYFYGTTIGSGQCCILFSNSNFYPIANYCIISDGSGKNLLTGLCFF
jgi:hypothetical protein